MEEGFDGVAALKKIEAIGRVSHRSEDRVTDDSYQRFIQSVVMNHGDLSIIEHVSVTVFATLDRGLSHEWVRHRLFSYTQESTRFVNYDKPEHEPRFIKPSDLFGMNETRDWETAVNAAMESYKHLLFMGYAPQIARSVLPTCLATKLVITGNLRNWRHFFIMRTTKETHPQMLEATIPLLDEFKMTIPILFDDIKTEVRQAEQMRLLR